jgi:hypothetical protein
MPFVRGRIVIDFHWSGKGRTAIRTPRDHYVCAVAVARWTNAAHQINVVISRSTRAIHCKKDLPCQSSRIYIPTGPDAPKVDLGGLLKDWSLTTNLRVTGAEAPKLRAYKILSTDK